MVLTEEKDTAVYPLVTFEDADTSNEQVYYDGINQRTARPGSFYTSGSNGAKVQLLQKSTQSIGVGKLLKVMAGDRLHIKVDYYMNTDATDNGSANGLSSIVTALTSSINNSSASTVFHGSGSTITTNLNSSTPFTSFLSPESGSGGSMPKAYLNILFFDEQFNFVSTNSEIIQVDTKGSGQTITRIGGSAKEAAKNGYAYVFVSNESNNLVYFDNFQVTHERGPLTEETHYYPFGLTMSGISSKSLNFGNPENKKKKFQGQEFNDDLGVDIYEFKYRMDDPQIGRFWQVDPLANKYVYNSTYAFSEDKVTSHFELEGLEARLAIAGVGHENTAYKQSDINAFDARAKRLGEVAGFTPSQAENGQEIISTLKQATKDQGSIDAVAFFAHSGPVGIYLNNNDGFYRGDEMYSGIHSANVANVKEGMDADEIKFNKNAFVVFGGCNCSKGENPLAYSFTEETGVTSYGANSEVAPEIKNGKETGKLKTSGHFIKFESKTENKQIEVRIGWESISINVPVTEVKQTNVGSKIDVKDLVQNHNK